MGAFSLHLRVVQPDQHFKAESVLSGHETVVLRNVPCMCQPAPLSPLLIIQQRSATTGQAPKPHRNVHTTPAPDCGGEGASQ